MYRKKAKGWTKHLDFILLDILCMQLAFVISYIIRFGTDNPYMDNEYRILAIAFLFIDFFVEIVSDSFKNVLKRGYFEELIATCKHVILVELVATLYLFTVQMGEIYSRISYYIMIPLYITISYTARLIWKRTLRKRELNFEWKITSDPVTGSNSGRNTSDSFGETSGLFQNRSRFSGFRSERKNNLWDSRRV